MNARLPSNIPEGPWHETLESFGVKRIHRGKVRDTYQLAPGYRLQVATDRISIFDFVLPASVPGKGEILTALTVYWLKEVLSDFEHHLVGFGQDIDSFLPADMFVKPELRKRAVVVRSLAVWPVECIMRGYLTGTGWTSYHKTGQVCGHQLPPGLYDGSQLPEPIFTPTTKAEEGHDEHIDAQSVSADLALLSRRVYEKAAAFAKERGVIIADTKFEFGKGLDSEEPILGDEVLTPDSSRFWDEDEWQKASKEKKSPPSYDKQVAREWGKKVPTGWGTGIHELDPVNVNHRSFIQSLYVPQEILQETSDRYRTIFQRLMSMTLHEYQQRVMKVSSAR